MLISFTACGSGQSLTGSSGFFTSPNFPSNFPQYSNCTWNITVPSGYIIKLTFHHFQLGRYRYGARVTITNVASDNDRQPFQLYGQSIPAPVYSVDNFIQVIFTSQTYQYSGFNASSMAITYDSGKLPYGLSFKKLNKMSQYDFCLMNLKNKWKVAFLPRTTSKFKNYHKAMDGGAGLNGKRGPVT